MMNRSANAAAPYVEKSLSNLHVAGAALLIAGTVNILLNTIAEGTYPGYDLSTNALSDLGAIGSRTFLLWNGQVLATGLLLLVGAILFLRSSALSIPNRRLAWVFYIAWPAGAIIVSLFPENSILAIHAIAAFMVFIFGGLGPLYAYRFTKPPFRYLSVLLGVISLISIPLLGTPVIGFGLAERLVIYPGIIWSIAFGGYLLSID